VRLPKKMALELFKPFISTSSKTGLGATIHRPRDGEQRSPSGDILEEVIKEHPVLLNRAPTLHRLRQSAFDRCSSRQGRSDPSSRCTAFNADFDGGPDGGAHSLSPERRFEASVLMLSSTTSCRPPTAPPSRCRRRHRARLLLPDQGQAGAKAKAAPSVTLKTWCWALEAGSSKRFRRFVCATPASCRI